VSSLQPRALTRTLSSRLVPSHSSAWHVLLPFPNSQFRPDPPQDVRAGCKQKTAASRRVQGTLCAPNIVLVPL